MFNFNRIIGIREDDLMLMFDGIPSLIQTKRWFESDSTNSRISGPGYLPLKRLIDVVLSILLLVLALPVLAACAIAIKLDSPGPVLFSQMRTGIGENRFKVYKFRTMVKNAAELKEKYLHFNELSPPDFKIKNDPRLTFVGRILRKLSLDELPQLINVIKGNMSLVGPRPSSYNARTYALWHTVRFEIKPGLTGLAQISGRSRLLLDEKVRYDISYLRNISLALDFKILLKTIRVVLSAEGVK
jgi:lipopolysaccharide/colanic/teichoic acid biosynthesis glycosyltransferase